MAASSAGDTVDLDDGGQAGVGTEPSSDAALQTPQPPSGTGGALAAGKGVDDNLNGAMQDVACALDRVVETCSPVSDASTQALLEVVQKQSALMTKYQQRLDATNARLTRSERLLNHISELNPELADFSEASVDGYEGMFSPAEQLSDDALRRRLGPATPAALVSPLSGPAVPELNKALPAARGTRWPAGDRRKLGGFDARYHSVAPGATPGDFRVLPERIILVRHAQSEGNIDNVAYTYIPDPQIPLTATGKVQAEQAGARVLDICAAAGPNHKFFFYTSPYRRSVETYAGMTSVIPRERVVGVQEEVQLREQDFGNFQDSTGKQQEKSERLRFGRFFYRFPNGESGADVYDRITIFEDHMVRDINAGRFSSNSSLVLLTHGLSLRIFLMRWFHWTVDEFLNVFNPPNAEPLVLERVCSRDMASGSLSWIHTKSLYRLSDKSRQHLKGVTDDMCCTSEHPNGISSYPQERRRGPAASRDGNDKFALPREEAV